MTAVYSFVNFLGILWPAAGSFILPRINTITFIHAFAWIFVLSSVIPAIILGKGRSVLLQFFLCLTITFVAVSVEDILTFLMGATPADKLQAFAFWFQNPVIAIVYLSAPYLFMLYLDIHSRRKSKKEKELEESEVVSPEVVVPTEEEKADEYAVINSVCEKPQKACQKVKKNRINYLFSASAACFLLAFLTFLLGDNLFNAILNMSYKLAYVAIFIVLGAVLLGLGFYSTTIQERIFR